MLQPDPAEILVAKMFPEKITPVASPEFVPDSFAVRANIYWFLSLVLSLSTVVVGVISMQWLREYQRGDSNTAPEDALGPRQMRFQGLLTWHVPEIINALPLLLETAVFLFFCGVLDLLWSIHYTVAIIITIPVVLLAIFLVATTVLPALQYAFTRQLNLRIPQCPYKSPQSWIFHRFFSSVCVLTLRITETFNFKSLFHFRTRERHSLFRKLFAASDWPAYDKRWRQQRDIQLNEPQPGGLIGHTIVRDDIAKGLAWIVNSFSRDLRSITALYKRFQSLRDDEKEAMLLNCEHATPLSVDFRNKLGGKNVPAVGDYLCLRALDHLLAAIGYGSDATRDLLQHRVELYIRVMRACIHIDRRPMLHCPFRYYSRFSEEVQIQLLRISTLFLSRSERETDFTTAIMILSQTSLHPAIRSPAFTHPHKDLDRLSDNNHVGVMDKWEELRQGFSNALAEATNSLLRRPEIVKDQLVRIQVYRWFLRVM